MSTNRYDRISTKRVVKLGLFVSVLSFVFTTALPRQSRGDQAEGSPKIKKAANPSAESDPEAVALLHQMMNFIGNGPAFDAKIRETVWTAGREVVGVGTYEQRGGGSGQFNLQITMHADGKHRLQQISDGKLAWTRTEIAGKVNLRRVDVGRLEEWVRGSTLDSDISPKLKVGAWGEMLSTMASDYAVRMDTAKLKSEPSRDPEAMRVLIGDLKSERRAEVLSDAERSDWPFLYPTRMHVAVKATPDTETGLGHWIPARIEFWSDPIDSLDSSGERRSRRRLITLIELYSLRQITPPPPERFRFDNQDAEVNFVNETDRYVESYGVNLTQGQRQLLWR
jgi:hypothetical protein